MKWIFGTTSDFPETEYDRIRSVLTPSRAARIEKLKHPRDRHRSLTGDLLLEKLLWEQFGIRDARVEMSPAGQPFIADGSLHISIAHSRDAVVCAVSETPVGIDIEQIRPIDLGIIRHVCTPEEAEYLLGHTPAPEEPGLCRDPAILQRFFEVWTGKEAYFKQAGTGITDLKRISILPLPRKIILRDGFLITIIHESQSRQH